MSTSDEAASSPAGSPVTAVRTLVLTDLVGSTHLTARLGDRRASEISALHDRRTRQLVEEHSGLEIDKTDGFLLLFDRPAQAVSHALAYHRALAKLSDELGVELIARVGIHLGEVLLRENPEEEVRRGAKPIEAEGLAKPTAARVMALAEGGQTLLTRGAFDLARRAAVGSEQEELEWRAHGAYLFKGLDEPLEIFEVGVPDVAPFRQPQGGEKAQRSVTPDEEATLGWRPAVALAVPGREHWVLEGQTGEGGFGEVWIASHEKTGARRIFKFCFEAERLRGLRREVVLFRLLRQSLGHRDDIAQILDWRFEEAPYYLEAEYSEGGDLRSWAKERGGLDTIPLEERLEIVAQTAVALSAAHSAGVLHKDIKPANVLIHTRDDGPRARLTDFGIGLVTDRASLSGSGVTVAGLTNTLLASGSSGSSGGTPMYLSPEVVSGLPATTLSDIYSLGVVLYQAVTGDFSRALAPGWEREIADELLRDDIAACVDGDPDRRLRSADLLAERLRSHDQRRAEQEEQRRSRREAQHARRRRRQLTIGTAAALIVALVVGAFAWRERARATEEARLKDEALGAEDLARHREYDAKALLLQASWDSANIDRFLALLEDQRPRAGAADLRGFEWYYWRNTFARGRRELGPVSGEVRSLAWSADGTRLATGIGSAGTEGKLLLWDVERGEPMLSRDFPTRVESVALSPDGRLVAAATKEVAVIDIASGEVVLHVPIGSSVSSVAFSPDSARLAWATGGIEVHGRLGVWDLRSGVESFSQSFDEAIWSVTWSTRGTLLAAAGGAPGAVTLLDAATGRRLHRFPAQADHAFDVAFDPSGDRVAAAVGPWNGGAGQVRIWDTATGRQLPVHLQGHQDRLVSVDWSPDGERLVTGSFDRTVRVWNASNGDQINVLRAHQAFVNAVAYDPTGRYIASASDGQIELWQARRGQKTPTLDDGGLAIEDLAFSPLDGWLATAGAGPGDSGLLRLWRYPGFDLMKSIPTAARITSLAVSPDARSIATASSDSLEVWRSDSGELLERLVAGKRPGRMAWSPDGTLLAWAPDRTSLIDRPRLWNLESGEEVALAIGAEVSATAVAFSPDGRLLAWAGGVFSGKGEMPNRHTNWPAPPTWLGQVGVWDIERRAEVARLDQEGSLPIDLAWSHDGTLLASANVDATIHLWRPDRPGEHRILRGHAGRVHRVIFSPDDSRILSAGQDTTVRLWDVGTDQELLSLDEHRSFTEPLAMSPDGEIIASASADGTVKLWDGRRVLTRQGSTSKMLGHE